MATVGAGAGALAAGVMWSAPSASADSDFCNSLPAPGKFMIAAAASTMSHVVGNISVPVWNIRLRREFAVPPEIRLRPANTLRLRPEIRLHPARRVHCLRLTCDVALAAQLLTCARPNAGRPSESRGRPIN